MTLVECHNILTSCHYVYLRKCTVHIQCIDHRIYRKIVLAQDSYRNHELYPYIVNKQQFDVLFVTGGNLNAHAPMLALICNFFRPIIIVFITLTFLFYQFLFSYSSSSQHLSRNYGYTFCRASKDQSETGSLIIILCFSPRIPNSRLHRNCTGDIRTLMSFFCGLPETYSTSSILDVKKMWEDYYSLPTSFPRLAHNIVHNFQCTVWALVEWKYNVHWHSAIHARPIA